MSAQVDNNKSGGNEMNGLKYIRTRCNLSLNSVADTLGVTRQALSMWETGKKDIPEQRKEQLADYFGIDKKYFGEITEEQKKVLLEKAMFRYIEDGQETYRYKPETGITGLGDIVAYFPPDEEQTMDEKYNAAQKKRKDILGRMDELMIGKKEYSITDQICSINRGERIFKDVSDLLQSMDIRNNYQKMLYYQTIAESLKAVKVAFGLITEEELVLNNQEDITIDNDVNVAKVALIIKECLDEKIDKIEIINREFQVNKKGKEEREKEKELVNKMSIEDGITYLEEKAKSLRRELEGRQIEKVTLGIKL